jgi:uncharacterized protein (TIGR02996 family)
MRTFTYRDAKSHKFWNIELEGNSFTVTFGRHGTTGQTQTKKFKDEATAQKEHDKLVREKLRKGYKETAPASAAAAPRAATRAATPLEKALEQALLENPDELANHMAYADYLQEQNDPRGEFIQLQLALEDESKSAKERKALQLREKKLFTQHAEEWLGDLAPILLAPKPKKESWGDSKYQFEFRRGWLDTIEASYFKLEFTRALAHAPQARLLRCLLLNEDAYEEPGSYEVGDDPIPEGASPAIYALLRSDYLGNLKVFRAGEQVGEDERYFNSRIDGAPLVTLVKKMPKLEELYLLAQNIDTDELFGLRTLTHLRILQVYHMNNYPLEKLAKNPAFANLTHLLCHPHALADDEPYIRMPQLRAIVRSTTLPKLTHLRLRMSDFGDKGCQEIVDSGILKRLKVLDLRNNCISDAGAQILAACPDIKNLELIDLDRNCLTSAGSRALKATGIKVVAREQWDPAQIDSDEREWLWEGDGE